MFLHARLEEKIYPIKLHALITAQHLKPDCPSYNQIRKVKIELKNSI